MSNKHKNKNKHIKTEGDSPINDVIETTEPTTPTEPTMSDAISNALNSTSYLNQLVKAELNKGDGHAKISDIITAITNAPDSIAYKQSVSYNGYKNKTDITDTQQITKRVTGWVKYYGSQGRFDYNKDSGDITRVKGGY